MLASFLGISLFFFLTGCNYSHLKNQDQKIEANLSGIQRFVDGACVRCHMQSTAANRYVSLIDISELIEKPGNDHGSGHQHTRFLIKPGCPKESFFLSIIKEGKMPPGGGVSAQTMQSIAEFITSLNPHPGTECDDEPGGSGPGEPGEP